MSWKNEGIITTRHIWFQILGVSLNSSKPQESHNLSEPQFLIILDGNDTYFADLGELEIIYIKHWTQNLAPVSAQ